jgi:hypothetical protein
MNKMKTQINLGVVATLTVCAGILALSSGCATATRGTPVARTVINANMNDSDYEVLGTTEGKSTKSTFFFGVVQVVDGSKLQLFGIKFFEDQYAGIDNNSASASVENRAYYKALAATPDADSVTAKSVVASTSGLPLVWSTKEVTFQGKALKYKVHN